MTRKICVTYSHKRTCGHRAGKARLLFCQSRLRTPRSVERQNSTHKNRRVKVFFHFSSICFCYFCAAQISEGDTLVLDWTWSLQMRHFLTRGEQREQVAMCPQGPNRVSLFMSEHTIHSSSDSMLLFRDGLRVPTCPLEGRERNKKTVCESSRDHKHQGLNKEKRWRRGETKGQRGGRQEEGGSVFSFWCFYRSTVL